MQVLERTLIHLKTVKWYAGFTICRRISAAFLLACKLTSLWNSFASSLSSPSSVSPLIFSHVFSQENVEKKMKGWKKERDGKHEIWESRGGKGFSCSFTNSQLSREKNLYCNLGRFHMPIYNCWQDSPYMLYLHIDEEKVKTTNQVQK